LLQLAEFHLIQNRKHSPMLIKIQDKLKLALMQESLAARGERMRLAALYGTLAATAFTLANAFVNVFSFPNLPLGLDWAQILTQWLGLSAALALAGGVAGWFTEEYNGIALGGGIITALLALAFLIQMGATGGALTLQSLIMALPLIGVSMLAAGALRWTARRHLELCQPARSGPGPARLGKHLLLIVTVGALAGILGRMDLAAEQTLTKFHGYLQAAPNDQSVWVQLPVKQVPELPEHFGVEYRFYVRRSQLALGSLDLSVRFADGFEMQCLLNVGSSNFFTDCQAVK